MISRLSARLSLTLAAVVLAAGPAFGDPGRNLFRTGRSGGSLLVGTLPTVPGAPLRGEAAACASCHGSDASGSSEGGLSVPSLRGDRLATPRRGLRNAHDEASFREVLRHGVMPGGAVLGPAMPRYPTIGEAEAGAIWRWLSRSDAEPEEGVTDGEIVLAVPHLDGPRERALLPALLAAVARGLEGPIHGRQVRLRPLALPAGVTSADCGPPVLAAVAALGLARDEAAAAAARACFPLRLFPAADPLPDDLGAMQTDVAALAVALARHAAAEGNRVLVLTSERPDLRRAARAVADTLGLTPQPCRAPIASTDALLLLCAPVELSAVLASAPGADLLMPLDLFGEAGASPRRTRMVLADPRGRAPDGGTGEIGRVGRAIALLLAESLRASGRAVDRAGLRRALLGLSPIATGLPTKDCVAPGEAPRAVQLLVQGQGGRFGVLPFDCTEANPSR